MRMIAHKSLFSSISIVGGGKRGGDKIKISDSKGKVVNINSASLIETTTRMQAEGFLKMLADKTGWSFNAQHWSWGPYQIFRFKKGSIKPGKARYNDLIGKNPVSLAIISRASIEYTLDENGVF